MTVIALLSVAPVVEGSMASQVARAVDALDEFDVWYETNPMGTVIEADSMEDLMAAATAAHNAVDGDRVSTFLKIDDKRGRSQRASDKVDAVEQVLGRPARSAGEDEASPEFPSAPDSDLGSDPDHGSDAGG